VLLTLESLLFGGSGPAPVPIAQNWLVAASPRRFRAKARPRVFSVLAAPRNYLLTARTLPFVGDFPPFDAAERPPLSIDLSPQVPAGDTIAHGFGGGVAASVYSGVDPNAANLFGGAGPHISPEFVLTIKIRNAAVPGVIYRVQMTLHTSSNSLIVCYAHILCAPVN
jgi:hypothetical protein